jgi:hypothetical protein
MQYAVYKVRSAQAQAQGRGGNAKTNTKQQARARGGPAKRKPVTPVVGGWVGVRKRNGVRVAFLRSPCDSPHRETPKNVIKENREKFGFRFLVDFFVKHFRHDFFVKHFRRFAKTN